MSFKKWVITAAFLALGTITTTPAWAVFTTVSIATRTASATLTGTGQVAFSITLKELGTNVIKSSVTWNGVVLPNAWLPASVYIQLDSTITTAAGGIQIYTDNKASDAGFSYTVSTGYCAGLLDTSTNTVVPFPTNTSKALPMAWKVVDVTTAVPSVGDPDVATAGPYGYMYFKDVQASPSPLVDGEDYATIKDVRGVHTDDGDFFPLASPDFIYLEANFLTGFYGRSYRANMRIESFTE